MKVYLDDERTPPDGWVLVRWPAEAIALLESGAVEEVSLDHDLGDDTVGTGYDVVIWIEEAVAVRGFVPPRIHIHTANPSARVKMEAGVASILRHAARRAPPPPAVTVAGRTITAVPAPGGAVVITVARPGAETRRVVWVKPKDGGA